MNKPEYLAFHEKACQQMIEITKRKNADYAGVGTDPFANFRQIGSLVQTPNVIEIGFLTRMSDKLSRIGSFVARGELSVKDESVEDTLLDLANYCILFSGYLRSEVQMKEKSYWDEQNQKSTGGGALNQGNAHYPKSGKLNPQQGDIYPASSGPGGRP